MLLDRLLLKGTAADSVQMAASTHPHPWLIMRHRLLTPLLLLLLVGYALPASGGPAQATEERTPLSDDDVQKIIAGLNRIDQFPVPLSQLEEKSGVRLRDHLEEGLYMDARLKDLSLSFTATRPEGELKSGLLLQSVKIEAKGATHKLPSPPPSATVFDVGTYAYLPTFAHVDAIGEGHYRSLHYEKVKYSGPAELRDWTYTIDDKRGPFVSESERLDRQQVILGLLQAIRDDRFVEEYEAFKTKYPTNELGSHELYGYTITIMFFDDRSEKYRDEFLKKDGLKAYVGIHVYNEAHSEARYPHPYLFEFFGVERLNAIRFYRGAPYNPVHNGMPSGSHPEADLTSGLPDISAPGQRHGGLVHYGHLEHRNEGWTFECPGFYPHDGKTVATDLDPALLQFGGYTVTHSRPR